MHNSAKRSHTEQTTLDKQLDRMFFLASEQKLLPKIIYDYSMHNKQSKLAKQYRRSVKSIYSKETHLPLRYNPEEARTHRQKFRQKVLKLIRNQLPVQYLKSVQMNGKRVMTYKGHPLEQVQYPAKQQFEIFNNFNETKFKKGTHQIFDDKLQYNHKDLITNSKKKQTWRTSKNCRTEPNLNQKYFGSISTNIDQTPNKQERKNIPLSLPKLIARTQLQKNKQTPPLSTVRMKKPTKMNPYNQKQSLIKTMKVIGGYNSESIGEKIMVTKQSIIRYFKQLYSRPHRVIDFLEFSDVETLESYKRIPQKLKLMPNEHICFMSFLFYDSNNDGYICDNDLLRVTELLNKCPLLKGDYDLMKKKGLKVEYSEDLPYKQLYKLPQITQSTYFNWVKKQEEKNDKKQLNQIQKQVKGYFGYLNRKKIMINYEGFRKIMKGQKTFLWYDLLWRISGITFADLKYQK